MDPPIATVELNFFPAGSVGVVLVVKLVHLYDHLFRASHLNHCLSESFVADVSVVDAVVFLFTAFSCKLIRRGGSSFCRCDMNEGLNIPSNGGCLGILQVDW